MIMKQTNLHYLAQWIGGIITGFYCWILMLEVLLNGLYVKLDQSFGTQLFIFLTMTIVALCTLPGILILKNLKLNAIIYIAIGILGISIFFIPLIGSMNEYLNAVSYFYIAIMSGIFTWIISRKSFFKYPA